MVDTHCHLNFHSFKKDYAEIAKAAFDAGVTKIINVGAKLDSSRRGVKIADEIPFCFAAVGIHPHHASEFPDLKLPEHELAQIIEDDKNSTKKIVAIGECGLDYHELSVGDLPLLKEVQKNLLKLHIKLAQKYNFPLIVHCRDAYSDLINFLQTTDYRLLTLPGVIHCFQGTIPDLKQFLELGFYVGYDGFITYAKNYEELVFNTPLDRILTETDAPWLTPEPFRKKRNSPANIKIITEKIAEIKKLGFQEVDKITSENAEKLFFSI